MWSTLQNQKSILKRPAGSLQGVHPILRGFNLGWHNGQAQRICLVASYQQRLHDQITSLALPEGVFDELYNCKFVWDLRYNEWEFVKTCKRVKKRGEDPMTFFDVHRNPLLFDNIAVLMEMMNMRRIHIRQFLQVQPTAVIQYATEDLIERIQAYLDLGFSKEHVKNMFTAYPDCLGDYFSAKVEQALEYYLSLGLLREEVVHIFIQIPSMLGGTFYDHINEKLTWMLDVVGLDQHTALHEWLVRYPKSVFKADIQTMQVNYRAFLNGGFTKGECMEIFSNEPCLLSGDDLDYVDKIAFLKHNLGDEGYKAVVSYPAFFKYSFQRRILQRVAFMQLRGRKVSPENLLLVLSAGSVEFFKRYAKCTPKEFRYFNQEWSAVKRIKEEKEKREATRTEYCT